MNTTIAVVIPAFNNGPWLARTLDSVLAQTRPADEIILVDDGSTDNTPDRVAPYADRIRYIRQPNAGASAARNTGIQAAQSEWIALLDGDDEWLPHKLAAQLDLLARHPHLVWTTGNFYRDFAGDRGPDIDPDRARRLVGNGICPDYFEAYRLGLGGWTGNMLIRRQTLIEAGLFRPQQPRANDLDMWWRIAYRHPPIGYCPDPLAIYHMSVPDTISQSRFSADDYADLIARHLDLARDHGRDDVFRPFAGWLLYRWTRAMLFQARGQDIRTLLDRFPDLVSPRHRLPLQLLSRCPRLTAHACHAISRVVRTLGLRRKIVRKPPRPA